MIVIKTPEGLKLQTVSEADVMQVLLQKFPGLKDYDEIIVKEITHLRRSRFRLRNAKIPTVTHHIPTTKICQHKYFSLTLQHESNKR